MPAQLIRLRIAGFKSFAEPAAVEILPGLTGIVGPNGCGKSNVVEALRWAMGESSARSLRGGEMDDVIFAGTAHRASRNVAEVTLSLDDTAGLAAAPFDDAPELEVARRIERGGGSLFRINGHEVRMREVQTLFADLATGARASAMVSQGRVNAIVAASPAERRGILEEAAGITGLHARRHEAELKLRAAEGNLTRADDLRGQLLGQLDGLQRQARQAARYRDLAGAVEAAEVELLALQQAIAAAALDEARQEVAQTQAALGDATRHAVAAVAASVAAAGLLPTLRDAAAMARGVVERTRVEREQATAEISRADAALAGAAVRRQQVGRDLGHAEQQQRESEAAAARLAAEEARLARDDAAHPASLAAAEAAAANATQALQAADHAAQQAVEQAAELVARHRAAAEAVAAAEVRCHRTAEQLARLGAERDRAAARTAPPERLDAARAERDAAEQDARAHGAAAGDAECAHATARQALAAACAAATLANAEQARLSATIQALSETLAVSDGERWPRLIDQLDVPPGLEAALGAALGEELESAADSAAARHWMVLPPLHPTPPLPPGVEVLAALVQAPPALARTLSQLGLVGDDAAGDAALPALAPGQSLVSRQGAVWRWDGYRVRAGVPTAAAVRLQQRNRLAAARRELAAAAAVAAEASAAQAVAEVLEAAAAAAEQRARHTRHCAERRLERARVAFTTLSDQAAVAAARLAGVVEQQARAAGEHREAAAAQLRARAESATVADPTHGRQQVELRRAALAAARSVEQAARAGRDSLLRAAAGRAQRRRSLAGDRQALQRRGDDQSSRLADLAARVAAAEAEHAALAAIPAQLLDRQAATLRAVQANEAEQRHADAASRQAEHAAADADGLARAAEVAVAAAREQLARREGVLAQASHAWDVVAERILQLCGQSSLPEALPAEPGPLAPDSEDRARRKLERLRRERDALGPVNLRAELEAQAAVEQVGAIAHESAALGTAIARLRGSIGHLNREGRERLNQVFADIDRHFQDLFARMFGGGRAHLALVGSDDPLAAGLDIYCQPPGKKLATLSLLSGGEQALAALSLIFAVFRCNPAPICVLDEVDAPLDDANVERFCGLLVDMVRETDTRFLVVTHQQVTMARMDRLYGVTMQERGVSRLLSVDLRHAAAMVEAAPIAAE